MALKELVARGQQLEAGVLVKAVKLYLGKRLDVYWGVVKEEYGTHLEGVLPKSNRSAESHVRALRPPLKTSKTFAKWIARTQRSALRAFGQHALAPPRAIANGSRGWKPRRLAGQDACRNQRNRRD